MAEGLDLEDDDRRRHGGGMLRGGIKAPPLVPTEVGTMAVFWCFTRVARATTTTRTTTGGHAQNHGE